MPVYIGTSGFYYHEWVGPVYPDGTPPRKMLENYSGMFPALEINSTFYRPPRSDQFEKYPDRTGKQVKIVVKLHSSFTHERNAKKGDANRFDVSVEPLKESGQFSGYLAQFPQSFHNTAQARGYVETLRHLFPESTLVVEFRHKSWWHDDILHFLHDLGISMCTVDLPQITNLPPTGATFTAPPAYVRLHGRNSDAWFEGRDARYTYRYAKAELRGILKKVRKLILKSDEVYVFFNNHPLGNAAINANEFIEILREALPEAVPKPLSGCDESDGQTCLFD